MIEMNPYNAGMQQFPPYKMAEPDLTPEEKELALGATFYKTFARSVDNASRLIFPTTEWDLEITPPDFCSLIKKTRMLSNF